MHGDGGYTQRKDGRFQVYINIDGKQRVRSAKTEAEAKRKLIAARAVRALRQNVDEAVTVDSFLTVTYLNFCKRERYKTLAAKKLNIRRLLAVIPPKLKLVKLTPLVIQAAYARLESVGPGLPRKNMKAGNTGGPLSPRAVKQLQECMHTAFEHAVRWEILPRNPFDNVTPPKSDPTEKSVLSAEQVGTLFAHCAKVNSRYLALWAFLLTTGCRIGEALALRWADIDPVDQRAFIRRALQYQNRIGLVFVPTKTHRSSRPVYLGMHVSEILAGHRSQQDQQRAESAEDWNDEDLVFCTRRGGRLSPSTVWDAFRTDLKAAGLEVFRVHDTRHTFATELYIHANVNEEIVAKAMGHTNSAMLRKEYAHVKTTMGVLVAEAIDRRLFKEAAAEPS